MEEYGKLKEALMIGFILTRCPQVPISLPHGIRYFELPLTMLWFFPTEVGDVQNAMEAFKLISGLPYCVGAIDGIHIRWLMCLKSQFHEYKC